MFRLRGDQLTSFGDGDLAWENLVEKLEIFVVLQSMNGSTLTSARERWSNLDVVSEILVAELPGAGAEWIRQRQRRRLR